MGWLPHDAPDALNTPRVDGAIRAVTRMHLWLWKATRGWVGGWFLGTRMCLLTTSGRKSGLSRTKPMVYALDGDRVLVVASKGGSARHPLWYLNLVAEPECEVDLGPGPKPYVASTASAEDKQRLWPKVLAVWPQFDDYQRWTDRDIPVIILEPR
jgi:F420H(2)-dependent quinone reductase